MHVNRHKIFCQVTLFVLIGQNIECDQDAYPITIDIFAACQDELIITLEKRYQLIVAISGSNISSEFTFVSADPK